MTLGIAGLYSGGTIEVHIGSPTGTLAGTLHVAATGSWSKYTSQTAAVAGLTGVQTVYLVFKGSAKGIANLSTIQFS